MVFLSCHKKQPKEQFFPETNVAGILKNPPATGCIVQENQWHNFSITVYYLNSAPLCRVLLRDPQDSRTRIDGTNKPTKVTFPLAVKIHDLAWIGLSSRFLKTRYSVGHHYHSIWISLLAKVYLIPRPHHFWLSSKDEEGLFSSSCCF